MSDYIKMTAGERSEFRKAVTASAGWKSYRTIRGLNAATMSTEAWQDAGRALGINAADYVGKYEPKPRTVVYVDAINDCIAPIVEKLSDRDREFVSRIRDDADRNAGMITTAQAQALWNVSRRYADDKPAPAPVPAPESPKVETMPAPAPVPTRPANESPVTDTADAAAKIAEILAGVAGNARLDEARVVELIREHGGSPAHVTIDLRTPAMPEGVPGERVMHYREPLLMAAVNAGVNVMLVGPAGSGKTTAAQNVAQALGIPFYFTGAIDSPYKLLGFVDAQGRVVRTPFREAFEHGGLFLFDEYDGSLTGATLPFNAATANRVCDFPDGIIKAHPDFRAVAACNTYGRGSDRQYVGRLQQDAAALDRFATLTWDYDPALESAMIGLPRPSDAPLPASIAPITSDTAVREIAALWFERVRKVRARIEEQKIRHVVSPRATVAGVKLLSAGWNWHETEEAVIFKGLDADSRAKLAA